MTMKLPTHCAPLDGPAGICPECAKDILLAIAEYEKNEQLFMTLVDQLIQTVPEARSIIVEFASDVLAGKASHG